jgi:hypothetical protein
MRLNKSADSGQACLIPVLSVAEQGHVLVRRASLFLNVRNIPHDAVSVSDSEHGCVGAPSAGGTANKRFTIDVSDYVRNALNGLTDSRTRVAFAVVRLFRYNAAGGGTFGYPADSLGSNQVVCARRLTFEGCALTVGVGVHARVRLRGG